MSPSFLWYDLETFGRDPHRTRIAQFAGQRTDAELNPIGPPLVLFCKPADDLLPSPGASVITGITPQRAQREGLHEAAFVARMAEALMQPQTCAVGYNSLRFDDEFVRCALYRNFHDPYEREWRGGNSRWDLLDLMRLAHALRPEGMQWPTRPDGSASFKLGELAAANGIEHRNAHEALSDVEALIGLARRLRQAQPRLFDYYFALRDKKAAAALVDVVQMTPLLHVSGKYPAARRCAALVLPLARNPQIDTRIIAYDLDADPEPLLRLAPDAIADRLYTPTADLPEGIARVPLKEIHLNRSPALVPLKFLRPQDIERLGLDMQTSLANAQRIRDAGGVAEKVRRVFARERERAASDADGSIYDGFAGDADRRLFPLIRSSPVEALAEYQARLGDPRYVELLFRYRARNWPQSLNHDEQRRWDDYRRRRLGVEPDLDTLYVRGADLLDGTVLDGAGLDGAGLGNAGLDKRTLETTAPGQSHGDPSLSEYTLRSYRAEIAHLRAMHAQAPEIQVLMDALEDWGDAIARSLAGGPAHGDLTLRESPAPYPSDAAETGP